jgi:hypothetical protein
LMRDPNTRAQALQAAKEGRVILNNPEAAEAAALGGFQLQ